MTDKEREAWVAENNAERDKEREERKKLSTKEVMLRILDEAMELRKLLAAKEDRSKQVKAGMADAAKKHGYKYGRKSKLDYREIRRLDKGGMKQAKIAEKFGVTRARISQILNLKEKP
jgi:hypothetical protein